jgi:imidazolonepropionase
LEQNVIQFLSIFSESFENNIISNYGEMKDCPSISDQSIIDATGKMVLPTWCDSHTHLVYAGNREQEFVDRINGMT